MRGVFIAVIAASSWPQANQPAHVLGNPLGMLANQKDPPKRVFFTAGL